MFLDNTVKGKTAPQRTEMQIHVMYRKLLVLVSGMECLDDIAYPTLLSLQGLYGADGGIIGHINGDGARLLAATGMLTHMSQKMLDINNELMQQFLVNDEPKIYNRSNLSKRYVELSLNANMQSMLACPIVLDGRPYGLLAFSSTKHNYFSLSDAKSLIQFARYMAMLIDVHCGRKIKTETNHYDRMGKIYSKLLPNLHLGTVELLHAFGQMRESYLANKYQAMGDALSTSLGCIEAMSKRIQDLRDLNEISKRPDYKPTEVDLRQVLENVAEYNRTQVESVSKFTLAIAADIPKIRADFSLVWQAMHELLQNAIHAVRDDQGTPQTHEISIRGYVQPNLAIIDIIDTGCGIPPEHKRHIFEPFYSTWAPNRGVGLTKAYLNIMHLGGELEIQTHHSRGTVANIVFRDEQHIQLPQVF